jgi:D-alanine-D-alanine ligase
MRRRIAVLFGGRSAEHEISCISARSVIGALDPDRYEVVAIGITRDGAWRLLPGPPALEAGVSTLPAVTRERGEEVSLASEPEARSLVGPDGSSRGAIDVVFPVLHGPYGEDGTVQGLLELAGIPYVGAGVLASAVGMDKAIQKVLFTASGLPVVPWEVVEERRWIEDPEAVEARAEHLGYPLFAKPATLGSSVGVTKVKEPSALGPALDEALAYARKALLEHAVEGAREVEVSVLGNDDPVASIPGEIVPHAEFYDYHAKYLDDTAELLIPADLPAAVTEELQRLAVTAFRAIDCEGMARVDFFVTPDLEPIVNEVNTIPGFTTISMYPKLWEASGVPYPELVDRLVELAIERHERASRRTSAVRELGGR